MIPAELLGLQPYHPHMDNGMLDAVQKDEALAQQKELDLRHLSEQQQHNRAEEDIGNRGLDVRAEHDKIVAAISNKKLDRKLSDENTKTWHQYNLKRIQALAAGDDRAASQYESIMDGLTAGAEQETHDVAPEAPPAQGHHQGQAGPAFAPPEHPLGDLDYNFTGGVARTSHPGTASLPEAEPPAPIAPPKGAPSAGPAKQVIELPEQQMGGPPTEGSLEFTTTKNRAATIIDPRTKRPLLEQLGGAPSPLEGYDQFHPNVDTTTPYDPAAIVREGLAPKKQVIELPEQQMGGPSAAPPAAPPAAAGGIDMHSLDFPTDYQSLPQVDEVPEKRTLAMPGGQKATLASSDNPEVGKVASMYRSRAANAQEPEKSALLAAADSAALERNPHAAEIAGERTYKNTMGNYKKTGPGGGGGAGAGSGVLSDKQLSTMSKDTLQIINTVKAQHGVSADVKGFNSAKSAISLVHEGERTGFGDTAATAAIVKSFNGANSSDKELGRFLGAAGKFEEAQNIINQYTKGNLKTDEYIRQMRGMLEKAVSEYQRQMSAAADEAEGLTRARFRGTPQEEEQAQLVRQSFEGGVWKSPPGGVGTKKGGRATPPELNAAAKTGNRYEEWLRKNGGGGAH